MSEKPPKEPGKEGEVIYVGKERIDSENFSPAIEAVLKKYRRAGVIAEEAGKRGEYAEELASVLVAEINGGKMNFSELERVVSAILDERHREKVWKGIVKGLLPEESDPTKDRVAKIINFDERKKS